MKRPAHLEGSRTAVPSDSSFTPRASVIGIKFARLLVHRRIRLPCGNAPEHRESLPTVCRRQHHRRHQTIPSTSEASKFFNSRFDNDPSIVAYRMAAWTLLSSNVGRYRRGFQHGCWRGESTSSRMPPSPLSACLCLIEWKNARAGARIISSLTRRCIAGNRLHSASRKARGPRASVIINAVVHHGFPGAATERDTSPY